MEALGNGIAHKSWKQSLKLCACLYKNIFSMIKIAISLLITP